VAQPNNSNPNINSVSETVLLDSTVVDFSCDYFVSAHRDQPYNNGICFNESEPQLVGISLQYNPVIFGKRGRGTGEYGFIRSIDIVADRLQALDVAGQKIIEYSANSYNYITEKKLDDLYKEVGSPDTFQLTQLRSMVWHGDKAFFATWWGSATSPENILIGSVNSTTGSYEAIKVIGKEQYDALLPTNSILAKRGSYELRHIGGSDLLFAFSGFLNDIVVFDTELKNISTIKIESTNYVPPTNRPSSEVESSPEAWEKWISSYTAVTNACMIKTASGFALFRGLERYLYDDNYDVTSSPDLYQIELDPQFKPVSEKKIPLPKGARLIGCNETEALFLRKRNDDSVLYRGAF
jgi:hypothetical protein